MHTIPLKAFAAGILLLLAQGCSRPADDYDYESNLPEANDINCEPKKVAEMRPKQRREAFAGRCFRRSHYTPSPPRSW